MKTIKTRFGTVDYDPANLLHFPAGMIGFPTLHNFIVMPNKKEGPLFWIQSIDDPDIAFVLTDPSNFFPSYQVVPDETERNYLKITDEAECFTLSVVTVPPDQKITLNLTAPILFSPETNRAIQIILENTEFQSKTPLPG
jgi:flagellar assembly factor FliW